MGKHTKGPYLITCPSCGRQFHDTGEAFPCDCGEGLGNEYAQKMVAPQELAEANELRAEAALLDAFRALQNMDEETESKVLHAADAIIKAARGQSPCVALHRRTTMEPLTTNEIERLDLRLSANPDTYVDPDIVRRLLITARQRMGAPTSLYFCPHCFGRGRIVRLVTPTCEDLYGRSLYCPNDDCGAMFESQESVRAVWQALAVVLTNRKEAA